MASYKRMKTAFKISTVNLEERQNLDLRSGDTVKVHQKIQEKDKTRLQVFEGMVLARKHGAEPGATFTVRKVSGGFGIERIFPLYSPSIEKIEVTKRAKTSKSKLYYVRKKAAKEISKRMKMEMMKTVPVEVATADVVETPKEETNS